MFININDNRFKVKVLKSEDETQEGMMGKKFNKNFNGMLFLMKNKENCFWMNNCIVSLDIIFIYKNEITKIFHNCHPCKDDECINYCGIGNIILEVKGGTCKKKNIKVGDKIYY